MYQKILHCIAYTLILLHILPNFTSSWEFEIFREYGISRYSRSRCNLWCSVRAQGSHEKTSASWFAWVCTGSAFHKQNWSNYVIVQKNGNGRKRSEAVGNMIRPKLVQPTFFLNKRFRATQFFFGPKVSKGKRLETVGVFIVFFPISLPLGLRRDSASSASLRFLSCAVKNVAKGKRIQSHRTTGKKHQSLH